MIPARWDRLAALVYQLVSRDLVARGTYDTGQAFLLSRYGVSWPAPLVDVCDLERLVTLGLAEERPGDAAGRRWQGSGQARGIAHRILGDRGGRPMTNEDWCAVIAALEVAS